MRRPVAAAAAALSLALVAGAHGSSGVVSAVVVPIPVAVSLSVAPPAIAGGGAATATATVANLGASALAPQSVTLHFDAVGLRVRHGAHRTTAPIAGGASAQVTWQLCGRAPGNYFVLASARFGDVDVESPAVLLAVTGAAAPCPKDLSVVVHPGGTAKTDVEGDGATPLDPVEAAVTVPGGGAVSLDVVPSPQPAPPGLTALGWYVDASAPQASAPQPLVLAFELDASLFADLDPLAFEVRRNGVVLPRCDGAVASPDPCLSTRALDADGDLVLVARSSAASRWTFGTTYAFSGFGPPVSAPPAVNAANAGRAVPVKFSLGGRYGPDVVAGGYPASRRIDCAGGAATGVLAATAAAGSSGLSYDAAAGSYTYAWKTEAAWAGTCRELVLRLADGTEHHARFRFR